MNQDTEIGSADRRLAHRYRLDWPVNFGGGQGTTRDISAIGIYFVCGRLFAIGESISFQVALDGGNSGPPDALLCTGVVVRQEPRGNGYGTAVSFLHSSFAPISA